MQNTPTNHDQPHHNEEPSSQTGTGTVTTNNNTSNSHLRDDLSTPLAPPSQPTTTPTSEVQIGANQSPKDEAPKTQDDDQNERVLGVADIIGEYGFYQFLLTLLTTVRFICVAMMTNTGPLIAPTLDFWCQVPVGDEHKIRLPTNTTLSDYLKNKCQLELTNGSSYWCSEWTYSDKSGVTLTDAFDLVCERDWLRSAYQSMVSVGVVVASVTWGSFSDKHGRRYTINVTFVLSLLFGLISYRANNFIVYALSRALCSMSDIGLVVSLSTSIVETLGNKYRGAICLIVFTGWAFGVMIMPWVTEYFNDFRKLMLFTVACHLLTFPWLATAGESIRWLLVNGYTEEAKREVVRISKWNCIYNKTQIGEILKRFDKFKIKFEKIAERSRLQREAEAANKTRCQTCLLTVFGGLSKVGQLFKSREMAITTSTIVWTTFNSELLYMLFVMINNDIGDIKMNYAIGGVMETLATVISIVMVSSLTRKFSLTSTLIVISSFCFCLAFTHQLESVAVWFLNMTKLAISTLSSLLYVTTTEIFPTNLRQTGIGLAATLGSFGAVIAPFVRTELADLIGMTNVLLIVCALPLTAATVVPFFLRETKGVELPDDIEEIDGIEVPNINLELRRASSASKQSRNREEVVRRA